MNKPIIAPIIVVAALGLSAATAFAQAPDFASVDTSGDGMVSMQEGIAAGFDWSAEQFSEADSNGDGALSAEEYAAATAQ